MVKHQILVKDKQGEVIGEFSNWFNLKFSDQLTINGYGQASFQVPITSDDAISLISLRRYEVEIWQEGQPIWAGEQVNAEITLEADSPNLITVTCFTYLEMFNARYTDEFIRFDQVDQMRIIKELIDISQAKQDGNLGFTFANIVDTKPRDHTYNLDNIMESIVNMNNVIDGMDVWIDHNKIIHGGNLKRGSDKSNQFGFEWGINIQSLTITDNFSSPANSAFAIGSSPDGITSFIRSYTDPSTRSTYKLREQTISTIDVSEEDTLIGKAQDVVNSNKSRKRTVKIVQIPDSTPSLTSLAPGDSLNVKFKKGSYDIDSSFRILGYECEVGDVGQSTVTWILADYQSQI